MTTRRKSHPPPSAPKPARRLPDPLADLTASARPTEKLMDAPLTPKAHAKYLRSYARRQQAAQAEQQAAFAKKPTVFSAPYLCARYLRRYGILEESLNNREFLDLFHECDLAAAALNAWQARRNGDKP